MTVLMRYRGRLFTETEVENLRQLMEKNPNRSRLWLSRTFCEQLNWRKPDGGLKDMAARVAMLQMEKDGLISLPAALRPNRNSKNLKKQVCEIMDETPITVNMGSLELHQVLERQDADTWNQLIDQYHYLGYTKPGGAQMRYLVRMGGRVVACLGFSGAAWKTKPRDLFIGWSPEVRETKLHFVVDNSRFLILPWVKIPNLASRILSMAARQIPKDWERRYHYRPVLLETFVEKERFFGTCYKAANWQCVGDTTGRGRYDRTHQAHGKSVKSIWVYPMDKRFREKLTSCV